MRDQAQLPLEDQVEQEVEELAEPIVLNERQRLLNRFSNRMEVAYNLNRRLVSFQANREEPIHRWFKYREGFSSSLVRYFLDTYSIEPGRVLDPFAGAGTTVFAGQEANWSGYGIELLPVGAFIMEAKEAVNRLDINAFRRVLETLWQEIDAINEYTVFINHIPITAHAFPEDTEVYLNKYLHFCSNIEDEALRTVLRFAAFSVLESISYTRKDGQYLRWDHRTPRPLRGKIPFNKGAILTFRNAVQAKLDQIINDLTLGNNQAQTLFDLPDTNDNQPANFPQTNIIVGTCLEELPRLENDFFDFVITSPPYCNRYDYTRTYALELVFLGYNHADVCRLRQEMLSCTVENKEKVDYLRQHYVSIGQGDAFQQVMQVYNGSAAMLEVNNILNDLSDNGVLNNKGVPRMVKNYFLELCFVIYEMARVSRPGACCVMVNDNVRYGGEEIPVDLILSEFAENLGYTVERIFVLPKGKGNSSQQMGIHGRTETRKCVYLWQKI